MESNTALTPRRSRRILACALLCAVPLCLTACGSSLGAAKARFTEGAYQNDTYPLVISYADPANMALLDSAWRLDNYKAGPDGKPTERIDAPAYRTKLKIDVENDGKYEVNKTVPLSDLKFVHRKTAGVIWIRSLPVSPRLFEKEIDVLVRSYVDMAARPGTVTVRLERKGGVMSRKELTFETTERLASRLLDTTPASLAGRPAVAATFEVADVSQLRMNPHARWQRTRVVLVKTGFTVELSGRDWPVLLIAGYTNFPDYFERNLPDFKGLLSRLHIGSDEQRIALLAGEIRACNKKGDPPEELTVHIDIDGEAKVRKLEKRDKYHRCRQSLISSLYFEGTGNTRTLTIKLKDEPAATRATLQSAYTEEAEKKVVPAAEPPAKRDEIPLEPPPDSRPLTL